MAKKVIIVDDSEQYGKTLELECKTRGFEAQWINDATQALEVIKKEKPSFIVLDVMMPGKHGLALLEEIQQDAELVKTPMAIASNFEKAKEVVDKQGIEFWSKNDMTLEMMGEKIEKKLQG